MNSDTSKDIIKKLAEKYDINKNLVFDIINYQFKFLKEKMADGYVKYDSDGNVIEQKYYIIYLCKIGRFHASKRKIKSQISFNKRIAATIYDKRRVFSKYYYTYDERVKKRIDTCAECSNLSIINKCCNEELNNDNYKENFFLNKCIRNKEYNCKKGLWNV